MYPLTVVNEEKSNPARVKVVSEYLFDHMRAAGVRKAFVVLRDGKWDIPSYWGDGSRAEMDVGYLMMGRPHGTAFTLDQAYAFVRDQVVVMGFPDVLFEPVDAYVALLERQQTTGADLVLGLFPASHPEKVDMVALDADGRPQQIVIKPAATSLSYTWVCAVWGPAFTQYLHDHVAAAAAGGGPEAEMHIGHVMQAALRDGMQVEAVCFPEGRCADIGTPDELEATMQHERTRPTPS
jgi:glucose-1-phosphate thymidylyltransferase